MSEQTVKLINKFIEEVKEKAEKLGKDIQKHKVEYKFRPENGERYYYLSTWNDILYATWVSNGTDRKVWDSGNGFFTREAAEHEQACRIYRRKVREYNQGWKPKWNSRTLNYEIFYLHRDKCFKIDDNRISQDKTEYFKSREIAQKFIGQEIELLKKVFKICQ
jgi:hypothetical protein